MSEISNNLKQFELTHTDEIKTERLFSLLTEEIKNKYNIKKIEDLKKLVIARVEEHRGAISYLGAISHIAQEFDLSIWAKFTGYEKNESKVLEMEKTPISSIDNAIKSDVNTKVSIKGFVQYITLPSEFEKGSGSRSQIEINDGTASAVLILWGKSVEDTDKYAANLRLGKKILVENAVVRKNERRRGNPIEIHSVKETIITIDTDEQEKSIRESFRLNDLSQNTLRSKNNESEKDEKVDFEGQITHIFPVTEFTRRDGTEGKVRNARISDKNGNSVRITLWNHQTDFGSKIAIGNTVYLSNFYLKESTYSGETTISPNSRFNSYIEVLSDEKTSVSTKKPVQKKLVLKSDVDHALNTLSGFLLLLYSSFLTMDAIPSLSETMFFLKVNGYMEKFRFEKINADDLQKSVGHLIEMGHLVRDGDHLKPA